jgi:pre-mRNA cleavage complex 2 protein Pcf11
VKKEVATMEEEVIQEYCSSLEELTANSKPLINMLTMLAEDNEQYAPEIVKVIESHLQQVSFHCFFYR